MRKHLQIAGLVTGLVCPLANGALVSGNFDFELYAFGPSAPFDPVTGSISYTFDNSRDLYNVADGLTVTGLDEIGAGAPVMTYRKGLDLLQVFVPLSGTSLTLGSPDWFMTILNASTASPTFPTIGGISYAFIYGVEGNAETYYSYVGSLSPVAIPIPGVLSLLALAGLGMLGVASRRRAS
jgi:hypothetical protein